MSSLKPTIGFMTVANPNWGYGLKRFFQGNGEILKVLLVFLSAFGSRPAKESMNKTNAKGHSNTVANQGANQPALAVLAKRLGVSALALI